jgi:RHS repeat-associated protein
MTYEYDDDNRMTSAGSKTFGYDANGGLVNTSAGRTYTWNRDGMLNSVSNGGSTYTYAYDPLGRRIKKTVNIGCNETVTKYVYDPSGALVAETGITNTVTAYYVYGAGGLISKIIPGTPDEAYYYHYDGIGSTIAITDANENIVNKYAYDTFGAVLDSVEGISNPFKYVGAYGVMDEGNGLLYMRARYYDPAVGRFINKDPIGLAGGINQYVYAGN